ncbi:MAG TPA: carbohydrate kinase [Ktedonobacterales bacterium]|nr:carbohydrate kinase [Ktedonobacterales bacterium]
MASARNVITCLGEGLMDMLPFSEAGETVGFRLAPAGSILNVAVGLARLGAPAAFAGKLADDFFGRRIRERLRVEGVRLDYLSMAPGHSTLAFVMPPEGASAEPSFAFYGEGAADTLLELSDLPPALYEETVALHLGSISLLRGTTPRTARTVAERLRGRALLSLDPNIRPGLVEDEIGYRTLLDHIIAQTDVLKLSLADLAWLEPGAEREDPLAVASRYATRGPAFVALTLGDAGAVIATSSGVVTRQVAPAVTVADAVGAGDAFAAGLLDALLARGAVTRSALVALTVEQIEETLRWATVVAALTCARPGANPPRREEALAWMARP